MDAKQFLFFFETLYQRKSTKNTNVLPISRASIKEKKTPNHYYLALCACLRWGGGGGGGGVFLYFFGGVERK